MQSEEIRSKFLKFFENRGHAVVPSASLVPENDPSVLFITAGMQPLVPYLLGEKHPKGSRLVNSQKCVRTQDIEEVGDNTHDTFFEMLGNWSLGDYFKKDAIKWSYEFLTSKEEGLGLDKNKIYITVFAGSDDAPRDEESKKIWMSLGVPENRIYYLKDNWWSPGDNGPCGPDTEIFYNVTDKNLGDLSHDEYVKSEENQDIVEIGNNVFIEYEKKDGKVIGKLAKGNVDFGGGLERQTMAAQGKDNIFETDLFAPLMKRIDELMEVGLPSTIDGSPTSINGVTAVMTEKECNRAKRIVADHIRTAVFMVSDGVVPSNTDRGYVLRRLLRRAVRYADMLGMKEGTLPPLVDVVVSKYKDVYPELDENNKKIKEEISSEVLKFRKTLGKGLREFEKLSDGNISSKDAFSLFSTYGFPIDMTKELAKGRGVSVDEEGFNEEFKKHQELSRSGAEKKFKGGLADTGEMSVKYHTATHLLNSALREVLGEHVSQKGSNITSERLRFDFTHGEKMTDEQKKAVEDLINQKIKEALPVSHEDTSLKEAKAQGAVGVFNDKYEDTVRVYQIGDESTGIFSIEICGGPHVKNTSELGHFRIKKEEASSAGVRRIKAVLG